MYYPSKMVAKRTDSIMPTPPYFSIIVPTHNAERELVRCIAAIQRQSFKDWELILVDDASSDVTYARDQDVDRLIRLEQRMGPAAARNTGAQNARGQVLFFTDSDCLLHPDALARAAAELDRRPDLAALIGSYDAAPEHRGFFSQFRNLLHHHVHQSAAAGAATFWTGCGAIRRDQFLALGGFDAAAYPQPSIEDIELGYRLKQAGGKIRLLKQLQVTHLKAWTLPSMLHTDIFRRALPWTTLLLRTPDRRTELNLGTKYRFSVALVGTAALAMAVTPWLPAAAALALTALILALGLNLRFYRLLNRIHGFRFSAGAAVVHLGYYFYSGLTFLIVWLGYTLRTLSTTVLARFTV